MAAEAWAWFSLASWAHDSVPGLCNPLAFYNPYRRYVLLLCARSLSLSLSLPPSFHMETPWRFHDRAAFRDAVASYSNYYVARASIRLVRHKVEQTLGSSFFFSLSRFFPRFRPCRKILFTRRWFLRKEKKRETFDTFQRSVSV